MEQETRNQGPNVSWFGSNDGLTTYDPATIERLLQDAIKEFGTDQLRHTSYVRTEHGYLFISGSTDGVFERDVLLDKMSWYADVKCGTHNISAQDASYEHMIFYPLDNGGMRKSEIPDPDGGKYTKDVPVALVSTNVFKDGKFLIAFINQLVHYYLMPPFNPQRIPVADEDKEVQVKVQYGRRAWFICTDKKQILPTAQKHLMMSMGTKDKHNVSTTLNLDTWTRSQIDSISSGIKAEFNADRVLFYTNPVNHHHVWFAACIMGSGYYLGRLLVHQVDEVHSDEPPSCAARHRKRKRLHY